MVLGQAMVWAFGCCSEGMCAGHGAGAGYGVCCNGCWGRLWTAVWAFGRTALRLVELGAS
jgi:hypothetical protein